MSSRFLVQVKLIKTRRIQMEGPLGGRELLILDAYLRSFVLHVTGDLYLIPALNDVLCNKEVLLSFPC